MSFDLNEFLNRVRATGSDGQKVLQLEFANVCNELPPNERQALISGYTERVRTHGRSISDRLTRLENQRAAS